MNLSTHPDYPQWRESNTCGCGAESARIDLVPDNILGLSVLEACCPHDHRYKLGGTRADKEAADDELLKNMNTIVNNYKIANQVGWWNKAKCAAYPHLLARHLNMMYYDKVVRFGDSHFNFKTQEVEDGNTGTDTKPSPRAGRSDSRARNKRCRNSKHRVQRSESECGV